MDTLGQSSHVIVRQHTTVELVIVEACTIRVKTVGLLVTSHLEGNIQHSHAVFLRSHGHLERQGRLTGLGQTCDRDQLPLLKPLSGLVQRREASRDTHQRTRVVTAITVPCKALLTGLCRVHVTLIRDNGVDQRSGDTKEISSFLNVTRIRVRINLSDLLGENTLDVLVLYTLDNVFP